MSEKYCEVRTPIGYGRWFWAKRIINAYLLQRSQTYHTLERNHPSAFHHPPMCVLIYEQERESDERLIFHYKIHYNIYK